MTRIDKYLKKLEGQRRSKPVTREMWQNWLVHPMTEIFFLSLDIRLLKLKRGDVHSGPSASEQAAYGNGETQMLEQIIDYEPHELTDEGETDGN